MNSNDPNYFKPVGLVWETASGFSGYRSFRAETPGGWIVTLGGSGRGSVHVAITFYPDPNHTDPPDTAWECISKPSSGRSGAKTWRKPIAAGWLVAHANSNAFAMSSGEASVPEETIALTFVPDPEHAWRVEPLEGQ